jgi:hypothetical protein
MNILRPTRPCCTPLSGVVHAKIGEDPDFMGMAEKTLLDAGALQDPKYHVRGLQNLFLLSV